MQLFYLPNLNKESKSAEFSKEESKHIFKVCEYSFIAFKFVILYLYKKKRYFNSLSAYSLSI